jgi:Serine dehydrogenase proteinase
VPTWGELLPELSGIAQAQAAAQQAGGPPPTAGPVDLLRRRYLEKLAAHTGRAVIYYGVAWHETRPINLQTLSVDLGDMRGFMEACSNIEERQVDLLLHSPGGNPDAAESIMAYLRQRFDHIRGVIPLAAMSAATMMALGCDEIVMGAHSQLGPVDPQITVPTPEGPRTAPAQAIKDQFEMAQRDCAGDPSHLAAWMPLLRTLGPGLLAICDSAQQRTVDFVTRELEHHMFRRKRKRVQYAREAADWFADHRFFLSHGRNVTRDDARAHRIIVTDLEDDEVLQDLVLSVSHAAQLTFSSTPCAKLIENHNGRAWIQIEGQQQIVLGPPSPPGAPTTQP